MTRALKELKDTIVPAEAYQLLMDNVQSVDAKTFCQQRMRGKQGWCSTQSVL